MTTTVRQGYPASRLPEDLRAGIDPNRRVTVVIVAEDPATEAALTLDQILALRRPPFRPFEEIDAEVRASRDEWDP